MTETTYLTGDPHRAVRQWLYILFALIVIMVLVGGATRLTDSGLSITEWDLLLGFIPPLDADDWMGEFKLYQTTDEFKLQNSAMTLEQFKTIYWWEWGHRFLGRLIGLAVLIPMLVFWARGSLTPWLKKASIGLFVLVCLQGAIGWWMVVSGLVDRVDVSQIRLAIHLTTACIFAAATIWVARSVAPHSTDGSDAGFRQLNWLILLILLQIFVGGLVAGLDAGMAYNTWPDMNGALIPQGLWAATPLWGNLTDNALTVQFFHRCIAYLLWIAVLAHVVWLVRNEPGTPHTRRGLILLALVTLQACIGITTLLLQVPISWALLHQLGGVLVLGFATAHWRALRPAMLIDVKPAKVQSGPAYGSI
ncbi:MAG: COX15/CtaA family protein [Rhizobiaceae bacterium]